MEDGEEPSDLVLELSDDDANSSASTSLFLVGKVISSKTINKKGISSILQAAWRTKGGFTISSLGLNIFGFAFKIEDDVCKILEEGPWSIMGGLLVLRKWEVHKSIEELEFTSCPFWIQVHGLPLSHMNQKNGLMIADSIGVLLKMDKPGIAAGIVSPIMWLRILVDITKPLRRGFFLKKASMESLWIKLKYERLSDFCYSCGITGHSHDECDSTRKSKGPPWPFGPELRALNARINSSYNSNLKQKEYVNQISSMEEAARGSNRFQQKARANTKEDVHTAVTKDKAAQQYTLPYRMLEDSCHESSMPPAHTKKQVNGHELYQGKPAVNFKEDGGFLTNGEIQTKDFFPKDLQDIPTQTRISLGSSNRPHSA